MATDLLSGMDALQNLGDADDVSGMDDLRHEDRVWLSIAGGKNVRGAPRGFQRVDADDDLPSAIAAALHRGADLIACAQLFVRGHRVLEVEDQRVGASNLAFSNARSLEPGI